MTNQVVTATPTPQPNGSDGVVNYASGGFSTDAGTAVAYTVLLGFVPRKIRLVNLTGATHGPIEYEYLDQMAASNVITKTPGATNTFTVALDTTGLIVPNGDSNSSTTGRSFTIAASIMAASSSFVWEAFA